MNPYIKNQQTIEALRVFTQNNQVFITEKNRKPIVSFQWIPVGFTLRP